MTKKDFINNYLENSPKIKKSKLPYGLQWFYLVERVTNEAEREWEKQKQQQKLSKIDNNNPKPKCYNCKHASTAFKIGNKTHHQCNHPKHKEGFEKGELSPWDTLQEFYNTCDEHEYREKQKQKQKKTQK